MVKEIEKTDISDCVEVIKESFMTVADEFGFTAENAPRFTAFAISEDRIRYQLENEQRLMIAYYDIGKIIGYYSLLIQDNGQCELNNLCVLPDHRHNGVGTTLLDDAFDRAKKRGCERINIGIVEENRILRKWYEKNGFVHTGTQKFDFFPFTCGYMEKRL
jgi:ribosomal protein S18 acetylase RimI-like enzyme